MPTVTQKNERFYFGKKHDVHDLPDLIESQKNSYHWFVTEGLKELFEEVNPIKDYIGRDLELFFLDYFLDEPRFDEVVAKKRNTTYEAALRVKTKLVLPLCRVSQRQDGHPLKRIHGLR